MHLSWQDIVLAVSIFAFNIALIPSVISKSKPALSTSVLTSVFVFATVSVYVSLTLWYAAAMASVNGGLWATLAIQKFRQRNLKSEN